MSVRELSVDDFLMLPSELQIEVIDNLDIDLNQLRQLYRSVEDPYVKNYIKDRGEFMMANIDVSYLFETHDFAALEWRKKNNIPLIDSDRYLLRDLFEYILSRNDVESIQWLYDNVESSKYFLNGYLDVELQDGNIEMANWLYDNGLDATTTKYEGLLNFNRRNARIYIPWLVGKGMIDATSELFNHFEDPKMMQILVENGANLRDEYVRNAIDEYRMRDPTHEVVVWYDEQTKS